MAAPVISFTLSTPAPYTTGTFTDTSSYVSPARSGYGVYILAQKMDYQGGATNLTTTVVTGTPITVTQWTWGLLGDGWYRFIYLAAPLYAGGTTYAKYAIVYDSGTVSLYQSQQNGNIGQSVANTAFWRPVSDLSTIYNSSLINPVPTATLQPLDVIIHPNTSQSFGDQCALAALEGITDAFRAIDVRVYEQLGMAISAMDTDDTNQMFSEGEIVARKAEIIISRI